MPHLSLDSQSLDASYPSIAAPVDDRLEDLVDESEDGILKAGERIASEIREAMQTKGRRRRVVGDMVGLVGESSAGSTLHTEGLVGESSAGSTLHTDRTGWSNLESQERKGNARARLVINVPVRDSGGPGGEETETDKKEQQEGNECKKKRGADPAANTFRRRSVKMYKNLGRITCSTPSCRTSTSASCPTTSATTTRTPESCPRPLSRRLSLSSQVSSSCASLTELAYDLCSSPLLHLHRVITDAQHQQQ